MDCLVVEGSGRVAEFQRQRIVTGTREGLDGGRPRALTFEQIAAAGIVLGAGQTRTAVAATLRVSRWALSRALDTATR